VREAGRRNRDGLKSALDWRKGQFK
jgi:hypothetical protein